MKRILVTLLFATVVVSLITTYSCSREKTGKKTPICPSEVIDIGEAHNAGLARMLAKLQALPRTRTNQVEISQDEFEALALETAKEVVDNCGVEIGRKIEIHEYLDQLVKDRIFDSVELTYAELTPTQASFALELDAILTDDDVDLCSLTNRISAVETRARASLTGQDLETVISGCYVASYTIKYWCDNADAWIELSPAPVTRAGFSWKSLGRADLQGGIAAGMGGLGGVLIAAGPVGWKGWAALVIGGAVAGSSINAWDQLWPDHKQSIE